MNNKKWLLGLGLAVLTATPMLGICPEPCRGATVFDMPAGETSISMLAITDPGNQPDPLTGFGQVLYTYAISQTDTTNNEYCLFLNSCASSDPYGLYSQSMFPGSSFGSCGIIRSGTVGSYTYAVAPGYNNLPVNFVTWADAARFCNWLTNGEPDTGQENANSTEDGSYTLNGAIDGSQLKTITRNPQAVFVIPNENEFYKASFFVPGSSDTYFLYPTQSNTTPSNVLDPSGDNNANFEDPVLGLTNPANGLTPVGDFTNTTSPWGLYDVGGDLSDWLEAANNDITRGGSFLDFSSELESVSTESAAPGLGSSGVGFRVVELPEPNSAILCGVSCAACLYRRPRGKACTK